MSVERDSRALVKAGDRARGRPGCGLPQPWTAGMEATMFARLDLRLHLRLPGREWSDGEGSAFGDALPPLGASREEFLIALRTSGKRSPGSPP
jgi:hypothetical protein